MESFHNTIHLQGQELAAAESNNRAQEQRVLEFYQRHRGQKFTPSHVLEIVFAYSVPLTSARRAITNLTKQNLLEKLDEMGPGLYGKPEHFWTLYVPKTSKHIQVGLFNE